MHRYKISLIFLLAWDIYNKTNNYVSDELTKRYFPTDITPSSLTAGISHGDRAEAVDQASKRPKVNINSTIKTSIKKDIATSDPDKDQDKDNLINYARGRNSHNQFQYLPAACTDSPNSLVSKASSFDPVINRSYNTKSQPSAPLTSQTSFFDPVIDDSSVPIKPTPTTRDVSQVSPFYTVPSKSITAIAETAPDDSPLNSADEQEFTVTVLESRIKRIFDQIVKDKEAIKNNGPIGMSTYLWGTD